MKLLIALTLVVSMWMPTFSTAPAATAAPAAELAVATTLVAREVKLRKMHLVRPDLIQYPIMFDVLC